MTSYSQSSQLGYLPTYTNAIPDQSHTKGHLPVETSVSATGITMATTDIMNTYFVVSGGVAITYTTPTAAAIVAAWASKVGEAEVGDTFTCLLNNANTGILTLAGGTGVTGYNTLTFATTLVSPVTFVLTNVTAGTEAVAMIVQVAG